MPEGCESLFYYLGTVNFSNIYISNKRCQCRGTDYWVDDTLGD